MRRTVLILALLVLGLLVPAPAQADDAGPALYPDQYLEVGDTLTSPSGSYLLLVQGDGNVVIYSRTWQAQWSTGTRGEDNWLLFDQYKGLQVYSATDQLLWQSGSTQLPIFTHAVLQDDGNLVIFSAADGRPEWSRMTGAITRPLPPLPPPPAPEYRGDRLTAGGRLTPNQYLAVGGWRAILQPDGNFVVYANGVAQWSTRTGLPSNQTTTLVMQEDGNAVIYGRSRWTWNSGSAGGPSTMVMQADGNLVVYGADGRARWSRTTGLIG